MWCPQCRAEYREGFTRCADCDLELTDERPTRFERVKADAGPVGELVEYPLDELSDAQRELLGQLLTGAELPFRWVRPHRLVVSLESADDVDTILDVVDASTDLPPTIPAGSPHGVRGGRRIPGNQRQGHRVNRVLEVLEARWLVLIGLIIVVLGIVDLIWTQVSLFPGGTPHLPTGYRWEIATGPIELIGVGVLIIVGAQIIVAVQDAFVPDMGDEPAPPEAP